MPYADKEKQREFQRNWIANRRQQWLLENGPCALCKSWIELHVDHIDPKKKVSHRIWSWSRERREVELKKCQPLCAGCHLEKHNGRLY